MVYLDRSMAALLVAGLDYGVLETILYCIAMLGLLHLGIQRWLLSSGGCLHRFHCIRMNLTESFICSLIPKNAIKFVGHFKIWGQRANL